MRKPAVKYLLSGCIGLVIGLAVGVPMIHVALWRMRPPLFREYHQLRDEIYASYLSNGALPARQALSASAQRTLSEHREIRYTPEGGLAYEYGAPYPANVSLVGIVTLGFCWGGEKGCVGEGEPPEDLIHNAKLRAEKAH
jgi:hypothetical protein